MFKSKFRNIILQPVLFSGKGLHTGKKCSVTLRPAPVSTGVVFRRTDLEISIPAHIENACKLIRCSGLTKNGATVRTCEHLLAALYACEIDDVYVDIDSEEIPIFDGSASELVAHVERAGRKSSSVTREVIKVLKRVESRDGKRFVRLEPFSALGEDNLPILNPHGLNIDLSFTLNGFSNLGWSGSINPENFKSEIVAARTFAPLKHALPMKIISSLTGIPIARGANLNNLLVFGFGKVLNPGGERLDNELARHRVLDIVGDLSLAGTPVVGKITAFRSSHSLNQDLVQNLLADPTAWQKVDCQ